MNPLSGQPAQHAAARDLLRLRQRKESGVPPVAVTLSRVSSLPLGIEQRPDARQLRCNAGVLD
jgi:hypothetical protein